MKTIDLTAVLVLFVPASLPAQDARAELTKIIAVEEQEHDLGQAEAGYRALLARADAGATDKAQATLRLGRVLQRLGRVEEAKALLEQAAAMDGEVGVAAKLALQGQGPDAEREKELRSKARELITRIFKDAANSQGSDQLLPGIGNRESAKDLLWIGDAATPEIIGAIQEWAGKLDHRLKDYESWAITGLAAVLWQQGGKTASEFLTTCAGDPSVELRRVLARSAYCAERADMVAVAARFLRDPDPDAMVQGHLLRGVAMNGNDRSLYRRLPLAEVIEAALAGNDKCKRVMLEMCTRHWQALPHQPSPAATLDRLLPVLGKAMASTDPEVGRCGQEFLGSPGMVSVRRGIDLLLAELPKLRGDFAPNNAINRELGVEEARALLPQFVACARALGPIDANRATGKQGWIGMNLAVVLRSAGKEAMPAVLELLQLGYDEVSNGVVTWGCAQFAGPEHAVPLFACFDKTRPSRILEALARIDLPPEMLPALRDKAEEIVRAGRTTGVHFAMAIARTGAPEAADWLVAAWHQDPGNYQIFGKALLQVGRRSQAEPVRAAMRTMLAGLGKAPSIQENELRSQLFLALASMGDTATLPLLGDWIQDMGATLHPYAPESKNPYRITALQYLICREGEVPHRYSEAQVLSVLRDLGKPGRFFGSLQRNAMPIGSIRDLYLGEIGRQVIVDLARFPDEVNLQKNAQDWLRYITRRIAAKDDPGAAELRAWAERCLADKDVLVRRTVIQYLDTDVAMTMPNAIEVRLGDDDAKVATRAASLLVSGGFAKDATWLQRLAKSEHAGVRVKAIELAEQLGQKAEALVVPLTSDADSNVRAAAAKFLGDIVSKDAVPGLLRMLTDRSDEVRKTATESLTRIRFFHEQQAHWDRILKGLDASAANAAEKLLLQAKPAAPKEQRLLAIRSLAALGAPESLPFLIDWCGDADAEIAAAAKAAVGQIHQKTGVK